MNHSEHPIDKSYRPAAEARDLADRLRREAAPARHGPPDRMRERILAALRQTEPEQSASRPTFTRWRVAAAALILISIGTAVTATLLRDESTTRIETPMSTSSVSGSGATLPIEPILSGSRSWPAASSANSSAALEDPTSDLPTRPQTAPNLTAPFRSLVDEALLSEVAALERDLHSAVDFFSDQLMRPFTLLSNTVR